MKKVSELDGVLSKAEKCRIANTTHGMRYTRTYNIWIRMKSRCANPKSDKWQWYGAKGVKVCDEWINSFESFLADMGECPAGMSIDRIDSSGNYEPKNCQWSTMATQTRNRSSNVLITFDGEEMCLKDWASKIGIPYRTLWMRLRAGWNVERMLTKGLHNEKSL